MFLIALGGLTLAALLFCWPLWRREPPIEEAPDGNSEAALDLAAYQAAYNAKLYQDFVAELEEDRTLTEAARAALAADKARQLLDDASIEPLDGQRPDVNAPAKTGAAGVGVGIKVLVAVGLVLGSGVTYWQLGTPGADQLVQARELLTLPTLAEVEGDQAHPSIVKLRSLTNSLRVRVGRAPEEAGSWYLLGIGELKLESYAASADAFESAHKLVGADGNLDLYWLQARLLADKGQLSPATQEIAQRVLSTQPNQPMVLNMLALAAYRSREYATAVGYLNSALSNKLTQGQREMLGSGFEQARQSLGVSGPTVDVDLNLTGQPPADAVLFVIARPVGGGMPYAVVRRPIDAVPERVRLDDAVSMNPANPLSAAAEVEIIARVSLSGRPQAGPGDWQWRSEPVNLGAVAGQSAGGAAKPLVLRAELRTPAQQESG